MKSLECLDQFLSCLNARTSFLQLLKLLLETGIDQSSAKDKKMLIIVFCSLPSYNTALYLFDAYTDTTCSLCLCSLFHVVVDNDETSTKIIRHLNAQKGGRVTFIPLNRVKKPYVNYPQGSDVIPLLKKLRFSDSYSRAFEQVCNFFHVVLQYSQSLQS